MHRDYPARFRLTAPRQGEGVEQPLASSCNSYVRLTLVSHRCDVEWNGMRRNGWGVACLEPEALNGCCRDTDAGELPSACWCACLLDPAPRRDRAWSGRRASRCVVAAISRVSNASSPGRGKSRRLGRQDANRRRMPRCRAPDGVLPCLPPRRRERGVLSSQRAWLATGHHEADNGIPRAELQGWNRSRTRSRGFRG